MTRTALLQYAVLALPLAFAGMPLYIHAPDFYAAEYGLSLGSLGLALLGLRLIDAVQDPLLGRLSDRLGGNRPLLVLLSALLLVLSFAALFRPLTQAPLAWFFVAMLLATTAFSILTINLNTLGGLWGRDSHSRTVITTAREAFAIVGLMLAVILPPALQSRLPAPQAFAVVAVVLSVLVAASMLMFLRWYRQHAKEATSSAANNGRSWREDLRQVPSVTWQFYATAGVSLLASAIPAVLVLFFIRDRLGAEGATGLFLALYFGAGVAGMPLWKLLSRRYGKLRAWRQSMLLAIASFSWALFLGSGDLWQYAIICLLSGLAFGAELALPPSILADHVEHFDLHAQASVQFSLLTFLAKLALAIGSVLSFGLLELAGFRPALDNSGSALIALSLVYALLPCVIKCGAVLMLCRIGDLDANDVESLACRSGRYA